ncbi:MAG TPA: type IV secretory system conjugative DNA transfer family protein [Solirubrobacteraceae bacterium]|jgi:type IV secretory pathway TraG/TraD family ATPase VirD4|nr:type IV secretory system conjugative DNA transfer family protein [Solirubrobacteraceae bacterium]
MPSSESLHLPHADPVAPVAHLVGDLAQLAVEAALGVAIGTVLALVMRQAQLRWTWAAAGLALAMLATHSPAATAASTLGITMFSATLLGRRWHRHDVHAGADLAAIAEERRGPTTLARSCAARASLRRRRRAADGWFRGDELIVGRDDRHRPVSVRCGGLGDGAHTLVVGSTGSGKTVTQTWIAGRAIEHGMGAVVMDPKGDGAMRAALQRAAADARTAFIEWTPDGPSVYNPYARGTETQIADKVLAGERFTEPHYLRQAQRYLGYVVRALRRSGREVSLQRIVDHLRPPELELLARSLPEAEAARTHEYLDSLTPRQQSDLGGVRDRLAILAESDIGPWLDPETHRACRFDLLEAIVSRTVVYFNLEADTRPLLAQMLAAAIVQDLQAAVANLQGRPLATLVVIDEFSAVAAEHVVRLFGRARSAGVSLLLGTQELSDLRLQGREKLLEQVMGNLSTLIAHRQVVPDSAQLIARLAGSKGAWRGTQRDDGSSSRTRTRVGHLEQDDVMRLDRGRAVVIPLTGGRAGVARTTRVFAP